MYFHVKVIFSFIIVMLLLGILYLFRDKLENISFSSKDTQEMTQEETVKVTKPVNNKSSNFNKVKAKKNKKAILSRLDHTDYQKINKIKDLYTKKEFLKAKKLISILLDDKRINEKTEIYWKLIELLGKINIEILFSNIPSPEKKTYIIKSGDSLVRIAKKFNTTVKLIQKSNGLNLNSSIIYPGQTLLIYPGNWSIKIKKKIFKLFLYNKNNIFKVYSIAIGKQNRTPVGLFIIKNKEKEPVWSPPGKNIPYGDPENVLGTRWMGLKPIDKTPTFLKGYGIHGTWQPESIGTGASQGCIRMRNEEVNELFDIIPLKTHVILF